MKNLKKLEESGLWKESAKVGKALSELLGNIPEEESYPMKYKIKQYSFEISSSIAEGVGSVDPRDKVWQYGKARGSLFGAKDVYKQVAEAGYIELDPSMMVLIEHVTELLDTEVELSRKDIPKWFNEMDASKVKS